MASGRSWEAVRAHGAQGVCLGARGRRGIRGAGSEPGPAPPARAGALWAASCQEPSWGQRAVDPTAALDWAG